MPIKKPIYLFFDLRFVFFISIIVLCAIVLLIGGNNTSKKTNAESNHPNNNNMHNLFASTDLYGLYDTQEMGMGGSSNSLIPFISQNSVVMGYNQINLNLQKNYDNDMIKHEVAPGETIEKIAKHHNISVRTILWANDIASPDNIDIGDILVILPMDGMLHSVKINETLDDIAEKYGVSKEEILQTNDIDDERIIFAEQRIIIPGTSFDNPPEEEKEYKKQPSKKPTTPINTDGYFIRPSQGVLSQGLHSYNAIDIANACWSPIYAAASGTVSLSVDNGKWNGGYGNFVTIKHPNSTTTLYAHLIKNVVNYGEYVEQGTIIGYMGSTGYSTGCHIHFEVHGAANNIR